MSGKHAHIEKARRNEAALSRFDFEPDLYEWYLTVSFYAAVHWIRAYLAHAGQFTGEREQPTYEQFPRLVRDTLRAQHGAGYSGGDAALDAFLDLKTLSQEARYKCRPPAWYARQTGDADAALSVIREFVRGEGIDPQ